MNKRLRATTLLLTSTAMLLPTIVLAGTAEGTITNFYQRASDGLIVVYVSGPASDRPGCASGTAYWIVKDENSSVGKGHFAMLLAAQAAGRRVRIIGTNSCVRWGDGEDIQYVQLLD